MDVMQNKSSRKALIIVDMQNDFCTGSLAVPGALDLVGPITEKIHEYFQNKETVVFTADWHPIDHCSFATWPPHCVQNTNGACLQFAFDGIAGAASYLIVTKGSDKDIEEYSGFANPELTAWLAEYEIDEVEICGVARNYCVEATYQDALKLGYKATILEDLCRSV